MANHGTIRPVNLEDWQQIYALIERVFMRKDEALFMKKLNADNEVVYSYLIERNAEFIGLIAYSRIKIVNESDSNTINNALVMAPFIIDPAWQSHGLGSDLIRHTHEKIQADKETLCFVLGEEDYYSRFGYHSEIAQQYNSPYSGPYLLAKKWSNNAPESGALLYPRAFADAIG